MVDDEKQVWLADLVERLGMPALVTDESLSIRALNAAAQALLGAPASECIGERCYELVGGCDVHGDAVCGPACGVRRQVDEGQPVEPISLWLPRKGGAMQCVRVVSLPLRISGAGEQLVVHCMSDETRARRIERYLRRVAGRPESECARGLADLTPRELEILRLLAEKRDPQAIAFHLHLSPATVRNHVQHVLRKLDAHSTSEAVARFLLERDE